MDKAELKRILKKTWFFVWEDDSVWSWIVNIILAFVLIKFIVYPGLGLLLGTDLPIVAVISGSMEHHHLSRDNGCGASSLSTTSFDRYWDECGRWYDDRGISKEDFSDYRFRNGFNKGDIIVLAGPRNIRLGDVVVFGIASKKEPIIHRVVKVSDREYQTKGDHNSGSRSDETGLREEQLMGKAVLRVPYLGYIKIWFVDLLKLLHIIK